MGVAVNALIATTAKQAAEAANFEVFKNAHPNFAGRPLLSVQWGGDPPDVLCLDAPGIRIGIELGSVGLWPSDGRIESTVRR
jgi:hypothetical protein